LETLYLLSRQSDKNQIGQGPKHRQPVTPSIEVAADTAPAQSSGFALAVWAMRRRLPEVILRPRSATRLAGAMGERKMASSVLETLSNEFRGRGGSRWRLRGRHLWTALDALQRHPMAEGSHRNRKPHHPAGEEDITALSRAAKLSRQTSQVAIRTDLAVLKVPEGAGFLLPQFAGM